MFDALAIGEGLAARPLVVAFVPREQQIAMSAIRIVALNERKFLRNSKRNESLRTRPPFLIGL
jgi:hypothetical protein